MSSLSYLRNCIAGSQMTDKQRLQRHNVQFKFQCSAFIGVFPQKLYFIIFLLCCFRLMFDFSTMSGEVLLLENFTSLHHYITEDDIPDGYLVWNPKCHMLSKDPMDSSIKEFVMKEKFEACSSKPLMSHVIRNPAKYHMAIVVNEEARNNFLCCWSPITRSMIPRPKPLRGGWDPKISVGNCVDFVDQVVVPPEVEVVMITCRKGNRTTYQNIHAIINPVKVKNHLNQVRSNDYVLSRNETKPIDRRKLSVLILGIDTVSRLNFKRNMPKTDQHLRDNDWFDLQGYNKMGLNTLPNLMAILTGQSIYEDRHHCQMNVAYSPENCPMLWYKYRDANYVTGYGEDFMHDTFNFGQIGFVEPPTDYYLQPYIQATETLLKSKMRFKKKYCTGPEISSERVFNYAIEFARTFNGVPYFGLFWINALTHDSVNGLSSMDERFRKMFIGMKRDGIMDDAMLIFLSDHGTRYGGYRNTFLGRYEDRLPFIYVRLPDWFRNEVPEAVDALRLNKNRLTSPYDLYETLRDVLVQSGGVANKSSGCPKCQSLFLPIPHKRGCSDAGISSHWCTCNAYEPISVNDKIAIKGTRKFLEYLENIIKNYTGKSGKRLCSELQLSKIIHVGKFVDLRPDNADISIERYLYVIEVTPGGGLYEITIHYHGNENLTIHEADVGRINSYDSSSACLDHGLQKRYCHCIGK